MATHWGSIIDVQASQPEVTLQKTDRTWEYMEELWLLAEKGKGEDLLLPSGGVFCTGQDAVVCICLNKRYDFCPHKCSIIDI